MRRLLAVTLAALAVCALAGPAAAEQGGSAPPRETAGLLDAGGNHTCAVLAAGDVRCWGLGTSGRLGYSATATIGDDETPATAGPVGLGSSASAVASGRNHTCAIRNGGSVVCWGDSTFGQLGYASTNAIGDDEAPSVAGPVNIGGSATAIAAGRFHTCAIRDDGSVVCWGDNISGQLGYGHTNTIGDTETPASAGAVDLGAGRFAVAIAAGVEHTCAVLNTGEVRCWGGGSAGQLGYANTTDIGDDELPSTAGPVDLGPGRSAVAITAGGLDTCAILDDATVRCWGAGADGRTGQGNTTTIGDTETPGSVPVVDLGAGRTARAISAGANHTCAVLDTGAVRCWGAGTDGRLGYGATASIGDNESPATAGPVNLGSGRTAVAITAGETHTCAVLDNASVRCWGANANGELGSANTTVIGDNETPDTAGPVTLGGPLFATADLSLTATAAPASLSAGGQLTYTITLTNAGPDPATPIVLVTTGAGQAYQSHATASGGYASGTGLWTPVQIPSGGSATLTVTTQASTVGTVSATAEIMVAPADPDSTPANHVASEDDQATASATVIAPPPAPSADLSLAATVAPATAQVGDTVTFTFTLTNHGPDAAPAPSVAFDGVPTGFQSQVTSGSLTDGWLLPVLASGQSETLTLTGPLTTAGPLTVSGWVSASSLPDPDSTPGNRVATEDDAASATVVATTPLRPKLALDLDYDTYMTLYQGLASERAFVRIGGSLRLTNSGAAPARDVRIRFARTGSFQTTTPAVVVWTVDKIDPGKTADFAFGDRIEPLPFKASSTTPGPRGYSAEIISYVPASPLPSRSADETIPVTRIPSMVLGSSKAATTTVRTRSAQGGTVKKRVFLHTAYFPKDPDIGCKGSVTFTLRESEALKRYREATRGNLLRRARVPLVQWGTTGLKQRWCMAEHTWPLRKGSNSRSEQARYFLLGAAIEAKGRTVMEARPRLWRGALTED